MFNTVKDMIGKRFGRLIVLSRAENGASRQARWNAVCDCGSKKTVAGYDLRSGHSVSCGCFRTETTMKRSTVHGDSRPTREKVRLYSLWRNMRQRCYDSNIAGFKYWGGRGIVVCDEWNTYTPFKKWALDNGYDDTLELHRTDSLQNYHPDNCVWITKSDHTKITSDSYWKRAKAEPIK